jgi:hypothetical protein
MILLDEREVWYVVDKDKHTQVIYRDEYLNVKWITGVDMG